MNKVDKAFYNGFIKEGVNVGANVGEEITKLFNKGLTGKALSGANKLERIAGKDRSAFQHINEQNPLVKLRAAESPTDLVPYDHAAAAQRATESSKGFEEMNAWKRSQEFKNLNPGNKIDNTGWNGELGMVPHDPNFHNPQVDILSKLKKLLGFKGGTIGDYPLGKATAIGAGAGLGAHYGGKAIGELSVPSPKNILKDPIATNLAGLEMERNRHSFSTSNLFNVLSDHIKNNKLPYGIGLGAAGLGGLGYLAHRRHNKNKDNQITESGEDQPGGEPETTLS